MHKDTLDPLERALHWTYELIQTARPQDLDKLRSIHLSIIVGIARANDVIIDAIRYQQLRDRVYKENGRLHCVGPLIVNLDQFDSMRDALDYYLDLDHRK